MAFQFRPDFMMALVAVAVSGPLSASARGPELGKPAPPLSLSNLLQAPADAQANWEALRGKVVLIDFWATWCGPCRKAIPHWNDLVEKLQGKSVQFLAITDENEQIVSLFLQKTPIRSWVGLEGVGSSMRNAYRIEGIPTIVMVNQQGAVVAVTHPDFLEARHIQEVLDTGQSSIPPPAAPALASSHDSERVPAAKPVYEVSAHRSGPRPPGHGIDCWENSSDSVDTTGQYASVRQAILTFFEGRRFLLDCRVPLPTEEYDFTVRLPQGANRSDREQAVRPLFRSAFGLEIRRAPAEREVYVMTVASTNAPGLTPSGPNSSGFGSTERGGLKLGSATLDAMPGWLEPWLRKPVINETSVTNRFDIRLSWKMSRREPLGVRPLGCPACPRPPACTAGPRAKV